jgi:hypothetical protein
VIASAVLVLVAMRASTPPPETGSPGPAEVIGKFLAARQVHDVDTAVKLFESDAAITDSAGNTSRGTGAAARLIERYDGFEAGVPHVTDNEVVWTEALPIRTPDNLQFQQESQPELSGEVPYYAFVQAMCAVVMNGKIHAVFALPAAETFAPGRHCGRDESRDSTSEIPDSVIHADQPVYTRTSP